MCLLYVHGTSDAINACANELVNRQNDLSPPFWTALHKYLVQYACNELNLINSSIQIKYGLKEMLCILYIQA